MLRRLLLDGDILVYRAACATESKIEWSPGEITYTGNTDLAKSNALSWIDRLCKLLKADDYLVCFGSPDRHYFRYDILPSYKQHRTQGRPPVHRREVEALLIDCLPSKSIDHLEADDVLGILGTAECQLIESVICTIDKDLRNVPGLHFNPDRDTGLRLITTQEADYFHLLQTLTGDVCDGFKGCPGIGPKKAAKILDLAANTHFDWRWIAVVEAFEQRGLTAADALVQAQVARICRYTDYDHVNQKVIPWQPQKNS